MTSTNNQSISTTDRGVAHGSRNDALVSGSFLSDDDLWGIVQSSDARDSAVVEGGDTEQPFTLLSEMEYSSVAEGYGAVDIASTASDTIPPSNLPVIYLIPPPASDDSFASPLTTVADSATSNLVDGSNSDAENPQQQERIGPFGQWPQTLIFGSLSNAMSAVTPPDWRCPTNDNTVPSADPERQRWVLRLLDGMNNITNVCDKQGKSFKKRWYDTSKGFSAFYSPTDKEIVCWDILALAESLHRDGPVVFQSFDEHFWDHAQKTRDWTFEKRMGEIVNLLTYSKARCEKLLGGSNLHAVVANPVVLMASSSSNNRRNGQMQMILEAGQALKKNNKSGLGVGDAGETS